MAEPTDKQLEVLRAIGMKGATTHRIDEEQIDKAEIAELVDSGHVELAMIPIHETASGDLAAQASSGIAVYMLTLLGATAIGEEPARIGLA